MPDCCITLTATEVASIISDACVAYITMVMIWQLD